MTRNVYWAANYKDFTNQKCLLYPKSEAAGCISRPLELVAGRGLEPLASGL